MSSVFKVRVKNSDNQKGKSGGYRLMYYLKTSFNVLLLAIDSIAILYRVRYEAYS